MARKSRARVSADHEARLAKKGGGRFPTLTLQPEEMDLWEKLMGETPGADRGKAKRTLLRALHALDARNEPTDAELLDMLAARLKEK